MRYILNFIYLIALGVYLPMLAFQRLLKGKKRPGIWTKFSGFVTRRAGTEKCVWFHAVSLGEINAIKLLVKQFRDQHPGWNVVISTTTQTGYDAAEKSFANCSLIYFPFDFTWAVSKAISRIRPNLVVLAELEIWPNFLRECEIRNVRTCIINGRLSERSYLKYWRQKWALGATFRRIDQICVQNKTYAERFEKLGVHADRITVCGNIKFDSLLFDQSYPKISEFRKLVQVSETDIVFVAGSTQAPEEEIAIASYLELCSKYPHLRLFICPRHPERFSEVANLLTKHVIPFTRRSHLTDPEVSREKTERVVLLDAMGELRYWWGVADIAFVGGSFGNRGGQNMLEPAALGAAVCFGPNTRNFANEVDSLLVARAARQLSESNELTQFLEACCNDSAFRNELGQNAVQLLSSHRSEDVTATEMTLKSIEPMLGSERDSTVEESRRAA